MGCGSAEDDSVSFWHVDYINIRAPGSLGGYLLSASGDVNDQRELSCRVFSTGTFAAWQSTAATTTTATPGFTTTATIFAAASTVTAITATATVTADSATTTTPGATGTSS